MKTATLFLLAIASTSQAYPGMGKLLKELQQHSQQEHQHEGRAPAGFLGSTQMLGDLNDLPDSSLSAVGADIKAILSGGGQPLGNATAYNAPGPLGSQACDADACCVYKYAMLAMAPLFTDPATGQCTALARGAIRLGFHDAAAWNTGLGYGGGGADGSILLSSGELSRPGNEGLQAIGNQTMQWYDAFHPHGASMADLIQLGAMTAVASCPGGPRMRFFAGRVDNTNEAADGLLPEPTGSADGIVELFRAKSFSPGGLAALVGAHTVSQQFYAAPALAGDSQDGTPGVWDNNFYNATLAASPPAGVYRFPSDVALSQYGDTASSFQFFGTAAGRTVWQSAFAAEYLRLSLLGVYNLNMMTDCSGVLPMSSFTW